MLTQKVDSGALARPGQLGVWRHLARFQHLRETNCWPSGMNIQVYRFLEFQGANMLKIILVATAMVAASPAFTQVRVLNGDVEHIYGSGGQLLDNRALQERNARIEERKRIERQQAEYDRRMQAIKEDHDRSMADIEQRRSDLEEEAQRRKRGRGWNLH